MKTKLNVALAAVVAALISTAYATCYLQGVVLCFATNDEVVPNWCFGTTYTCGTTPNTTICCGTGGGQYTANIYADENAYRWDLISVSRGGKNRQTINDFTTYCSGEDQGLGESGVGVVSGVKGGFKVYWYNANLGSQVTGINNDNLGNTVFYSTTASSLQETTTACN